MIDNITIDTAEEVKHSLNFLEQIIEEDIKTGTVKQVVTRFPPEPNGYLHIGHAKSICLNFGLAQKYNGKCNLRFDDTNPVKEDLEYVDSIKEDVRWLGFEWDNHEYYASDYFEQLYLWAIKMIEDGKAYVCHMTSDQISENRGTPQTPGNFSPWRDRTVEENLREFKRMRNGGYKDGEALLRAKLDMSSPNMHMRDPAMYRIKHAQHHRTGDKWCIYPMYDYAHGQSDYIEGITHSICTLEFEVHRPLYEWFLDQVYTPGTVRTKQREFARLNINYTIMSKRFLLELVQNKLVDGWDDPRMPTICGLRRRGYTAKSIRDFADRVGVAKRENVIDMALLEFCVREDLNKIATRVMGVLNPLKVVITNYPEAGEEWLEAVNNPENPEAGTRQVPFSKILYIEQDDFMEHPPKQFFRLSPGKEVRLRYAYFIKCEDVIKDSEGNIKEVHCTYDKETKGGNAPDGRKVKATLHWVSAQHAIESEVCLYDRLFRVENPSDVEEGKTYYDYMNPDSLQITKGYIEPSVKDAQPGDTFQFERIGYFCVDSKHSEVGKPVFNRTVTLKDAWNKLTQK
jgi:glutaminyl-tRNA synthetase